MKIKNIIYSSDFLKDIDSLPKEIIDLAFKKERIFREGPFHPSLRQHPLKGKLKGLWSMSINTKYRIIFQVEEGDVVFISIGKHDIYRNL